MSLLVSGCAAPSDATTGAGAAPLPVLAGAVGTDSSTPASDVVLSPTPPAAAAAAGRLIEAIERVSSCRYLIDGRLIAPERGASRRSRFVLLALSYRGPELQCRRGLETLNLEGAREGLGFVATRLSLARGKAGRSPTPYG
jgi:hypothetical protein